MQASQHVSLLTPRPVTPGKAGSVRAFAGVAQLVEHLFCKQVVSGSIPLASSAAVLSLVSISSSSASLTKTSEGCPSGQREQAVNLPAHAYVGSNPTPSTIVNRTRTARGSLLHGSSAPPRRSKFGGARPQVLGPRPQNSWRASLARRAARGMSNPSRRFDLALNFAGVTQLVESQFSKLKVDGSSPFSRSKFLVSRHQTVNTVSSLSAAHQTSLRTLKPTRPASLVAGETEARTGAERTLVREHRTGAEAQPPAKIAGRARRSRNDTQAHLAQLVEHVLGKDEVTSSSLVVGSTEVQP